MKAVIASNNYIGIERDWQFQMSMLSYIPQESFSSIKHFVLPNVCWSPVFIFVLLCILCVHSSFAIILKRKRKLASLLLLSYRCIVTIDVLWLFLTVLWVSLWCGVIPDHTHLLFDSPIKAIIYPESPLRSNTNNTITKGIHYGQLKHNRAKSDFVLMPHI